MTTIAQRIAALNQQRGQHVAAYEAAVQTALDANRDLTDDENNTVTDLRSQIEQADQQIRTWTEHETTLAHQAQPMPRTGNALVLRSDRERPVIHMQQRDRYPGCDFVRMAISISVAGHWNAAEFALMRWGDQELSDAIRLGCMNYVMRAPTLPVGGGNVGGGADPLLRLEHLGAEFIELLRPQLIVGRVPAMRRLNFNNAGSMEIPRQTGTVSGGYIGEAGSIRVQRPNFGRLLLVPAKLAVIVPATSEIMRRSDPSMEMIIRDDIVEGTARTVDSNFFSTLAAAANPAGILAGRNALAAGHIPPYVADDKNVSIVTEALRAMIWELRRFDVPMNSPVWIMNPRLREYLRLLRTNQEIFAFKAEIDAGTLLGYPIVDSNNVPINTAGPPINRPWPPGDAASDGTSAYALIDGSQVIWADDMAPVIDASTDATIISDDAPVVPPPNPAANNAFWSAFQNDMILMRLRMSHTWARRHDVAIVWATTEE